MMSSQSIKNTTYYAYQLIIGLLVILFSYAVVNKLGDFKMHEWQMMNQALPRWINRALIWLVPLSEIVIVVFLLFKRTQLYGLVASVLLMSLFTLYVGAVVFHFFDRVPCSCGGVLESMTWESHLVFNVMVTLVAGVGVSLTPNPSPEERGNAK